MWSTAAPDLPGIPEVPDGPDAAAPADMRSTVAELGGWFDQVLEQARATTPAAGEVLGGAYPLRVRGPDEPGVAAVVGALCGGVPAGIGPPAPLEVAVVGPEQVPTPLPTGLLPSRGETHRVLVRDEGRWAYGGGDGVVWMLDAPRCRALRWSAAGGPPDWEWCSPLRHVLSWWAAWQGGALVHAAAVATDDGAALLVGPGGSGKSTTALACLDSSVRVLGDDYCVLVSDRAGVPVVTPLYRRAKVAPRSLELLPGLGPRRTGDVVVGKEVVAVDPPTGSAASPPVVAVVATEIADAGPPRFRAVSRATVLRRLAPSTLGQSAGAEQETWTRLTATARHAAAFTLTVGPELAGVPATLAALISDARGRTAV